MLVKKTSDVLLITGLLFLVGLIAIFSGLQLGLAAQSSDGTLTIVLRDSHGVPIQNARAEILSYDWQVPLGQPYTAIAEGLTSTTGEISFFVGNYPRSGYRFRFSKTTQTLPADTFFESKENNQYRGYPAAVIGGRTERKYFVLASGLAYNDLSSGQGLPDWEKNPVGGLDKSRVSPMPAEAYLATVVAGTAQARASGQPAPTRPSRPAQVTPGVQAAVPATTSAPVKNQQPGYRPIDGDEPPSSVLIIFGVTGLTALFLLLIFRKKILEALDPRARQFKKRNRSRK